MSDENFRKNVQAMVNERTQRYSRQAPGGKIGGKIGGQEVQGLRAWVSGLQTISNLLLV